MASSISVDAMVLRRRKPGGRRCRTRYGERWQTIFQGSPYVVVLSHNYDAAVPKYPAHHGYVAESIERVDPP